MTLANDLGRINKASTKSAVKLQEIGPRMTLQLIKIEEGLCSGGVIFSEYGIFLSYNMLLPFSSSNEIIFGCKKLVNILRIQRLLTLKLSTKDIMDD
mgnify:CR=1 FL=1